MTLGFLPLSLNVTAQQWLWWWWCSRRFTKGIHNVVTLQTLSK